MKSFKRDFQRKSFKNPLFPRTNKKSKPRLKAAIILAVIIFAVILFINIGRLLKIDSINVSGNESVNSADIIMVINNQMSARRFWLFKEDNLLFFDQSAAVKELIKKYNFDTVKISKSYFHVLNIVVKEKPYAVVLVNNSGRYYLDSNGKVVKSLNNDNNGVIIQGQGNTQVIRPELAAEKRLIISDLSNTPIIIGQTALSPEFINFITSLNDELKAGGSFIISQYTINDLIAKDITMITAQGWKVMFNPTSAVKNQVTLLNQILTQRIKDIKKLKYIDLRYDGKVFYE